MLNEPPPPPQYPPASIATVCGVHSSARDSRNDSLSGRLSDLLIPPPGTPRPGESCPPGRHGTHTVHASPSFASGEKQTESRHTGCVRAREREGRERHRRYPRVPTVCRILYPAMCAFARGNTGEKPGELTGFLCFHDGLVKCPFISVHIYDMFLPNQH